MKYNINDVKYGSVSFFNAGDGSMNDYVYGYRHVDYYSLFVESDEYYFDIVNDKRYKKKIDYGVDSNVKIMKQCRGLLPSFFSLSDIELSVEEILTFLPLDILNSINSEQCFISRERLFMICSSLLFKANGESNVNTLVKKW